jgi:hypothetical protein
LLLLRKTNEGEALTFSPLVGLAPVIFRTQDLPPKSLVYHTGIYDFFCVLRPISQVTTTA